MDKFCKDTFLKQRFHDAARANREKLGIGTKYDNQYSTDMLWALRDMAMNEVWPDGTFSDTDCNVWSMFHRLCSK